MIKNFTSYALLLCIVSIAQFHANSFLYGVNLTDGSNNPLNLTTTFPSVRISLYDQLSGGSHAYTETFLNVAVNRGTFQLEIGTNGVDSNNNPNAKLPVLADQQITPGMPSYNYLEITITAQPLGDPIILSPRAKLPVIPVSADTNKLGGLSPEEWELRILDAKNFYTDSKAAQAAKDDGSFLVKNIAVDLNDINDQFIISVDDTESSTKIYLHGLNSFRVFELDSQGSLKAQTLTLRGGLGLDGYLSRDDNNMLWGILNNTHVNLGEGSVTGNMSTTVSYAVVGGGFVNTAAGGHAVVAGGQNNTANNMGATISGGALNISDGNYSSVGGGKSNTASGLLSYIRWRAK